MFFQYVVLGQLNTYVQKNEVGLFPYAVYKKLIQNVLEI